MITYMLSYKKKLCTKYFEDWYCFKTNFVCVNTSAANYRSAQFLPPLETNNPLHNTQLEYRSIQIWISYLW